MPVNKYYVSIQAGSPSLPIPYSPPYSYPLNSKSFLTPPKNDFASSTLEIDGGYYPDFIPLMHDPPSPIAHEANLPFSEMPTKSKNLDPLTPQLPIMATKNLAPPSQLPIVATKSKNLAPPSQLSLVATESKNLAPPPQLSIVSTKSKNLAPPPQMSIVATKSKNLAPPSQLSIVATKSKNLAPPSQLPVMPAKNLAPLHSVKNNAAKQAMFKHRQKKLKFASKEPIIEIESDVTVESYESKLAAFWMQDLGLRVTDKDVLVSHTGWLNDEIINAAQTLLKKVNPAISGLQDVSLGLVMAFDVQRSDFVQIINTGHGHWNTISSVGVEHPVVQIFDSMHTDLPAMAKAQIATLLTTNKPAIKLQFMDVQKQSGSSDCGLFAIAYATAIVLGYSPGAFLFDQDKMRAHLYNCFENREMALFPIKRRRRMGSKIKRSRDIQVFCLCRMPELPESNNWIECCACKEWYHSDTCVKVNPEHLKAHTLWYCPKCFI